VFEFNEELYSTKVGAQGEFSTDERQEIAVLRLLYPELNNWGDLAISVAWGAYSQAILMIGWSDNLARTEDFLNFLCWEQTRGTFPWGNSAEDLSEVRCMWANTEKSE
jgi:hypothetical protein